MQIKFSDSLTGKKLDFIPIDKNNVRLYVCGPTVYDTPHIGNIRSAVVFDLWFRLFSKLFPKVTYARNITDIEDKIINKAKNEGISVDKVVEDATKIYHENLSYVNCLKPTFEPKVSQNLNEIFNLIDALLKKGFAYESQKNILFDIKKLENLKDFKYGQLSKKKIEDLIDGARIAVEDYKKNAGDFILWKPALKDEVGYESPFGYGRPGWHIECSAMSVSLLGSSFDIHGGGADLKFPHHENEIAQSICGYGGIYAKYWLHNGFLLVNGEKMSKSLGNFITVEDLKKQNISGNVIRFALLSNNYNKPLNWNDALISYWKEKIQYFARIVEDAKEEAEVNDEVINALCDNLNTPKAFERLNNLAKEYNTNKNKNTSLEIASTLKFLGFVFEKEDFNEDESYILSEINQRNLAKKNKNFPLADEIRNKLKQKGIVLEDLKDGTTKWYKQ